MTRIALVSTDPTRFAQPWTLRCFGLCHVPPTLPFPPHAAPSQRKRIVVVAFIQYAVHVDGATIHVSGPGERQVEFGDGTTSFATISGGEGFINSTVTVNAPDFATMTGTSVNEMMTLIRDQQVAIIAMQAQMDALQAELRASTSRF
mmetsp:Transcript_83145/g.166041  ORF Transcript_83145/g.166041 Transcript_83145/m.166041 type:complete len:147 (-) Transcript_83145:329-769(-)